MSGIHILAWGLVHCSVCAPADMPPEDVAEHTNRRLPTGIKSRWTVSTEPTFKSGEPNPCPCETDASRRHWLMVC